MKRRLTGATFDASEKTILHASFSDVGLAGIQLITNVTDNLVIYQFNDSSKGGTLSTDTLTLTYDTTSMSDADELMILVEDGATTDAVSGTVTANLSSLNGAATSAKQDTIIGHVDGIEGVLATIDADTGALAGTVSGSELQIDVVGALPAGNNNIGDVDVASSALPTGAATSAKQDTQITAEQAIQASVELVDDAVRAEDVASGDGHKGLVMMAVRQDTPANTSNTDGDYEMPKMSAGRMWVDASGKTLTVDGSGVTQPVSHAALTELAAAIDTEVQVDVVGALPAGNNNIGDVDIASLPNEGQQTMANSISVAIASNQSAVAVDASGTTVPVSNGGLTELAAAINGSQLDVNIATDSVGIGGGIQYTEADTDASITGTAIMWEDGSDTLRAVSAAKPLPVDLQDTTVAVTQSGTWDEVGIHDSGNSITVDATNLDIRDIDAASDDITVHGDVGVLDQLDLSNSNPAAVAIVDGDGTQITSFGGGTQYTEGDTDATITGTALLFEGAANALVAAPGTAANGLDVDVTRVTGTVTVDGSGVTQPVSHAALTELAAAINSNLVDVNIVSGSSSGVQYNDGDAEADPDGTVAMGTDGSNIFALHTDTSGDLQVDILSSALPSGASTLAEQQSQTTHLATIAGDTTDIEAAVELIDDTVATLGTTTYTETTTKGLIMGAVRRDADTTLVDTTNELSPLQVDANGRLKVEAFSGETLPVSLTSTTVTAISAGDNNIGNVDIVTLPGDVEADIDQIRDQIDLITPDVEEIRVDADAIRVATELIDDAIYVDDTATHATGTSKGMGIMAAAVPTDTSISANDIGMVAMTTDRKLHVAVMDALPAGSAAIGKLAANSGVDIGDVDVTSIAAGTNAIGNVGLIGRTTGGLTIFRSLDIDETEEEIKATAGQLFSIAAFNRTAAPLYLKFYNATAANVTVGSTTPVLTFVVPGNADSDGAGFIWSTDIGMAFGTAITVACTTGVADADTGAPGANDCVINIGYV